MQQREEERGGEGRSSRGRGGEESRDFQIETKKDQGNGEAGQTVKQSSAAHLSSVGMWWCTPGARYSPLLPAVPRCQRPSTRGPQKHDLNGSPGASPPALFPPGAQPLTCPAVLFSLRTSHPCLGPGIPSMTITHVPQLLSFPPKTFFLPLPPPPVTRVHLLQPPHGRANAVSEGSEARAPTGCEREGRQRGRVVRNGGTWKGGKRKRGRGARG